MISIGLIGKTNVGKSTFFEASTLVPVERGNRPFVTINPNIGVTHVKVKCVHTELGVKCNPRNSECIGDFRFIPVTLIDVAGLIPGANEGKGLGTKFLDELRRADVLIHVVDGSGGTDERGNPVPPGTRDPLDDIVFVENEINMWFLSIIQKDWEKFAKSSDLNKKEPVEALMSKISGLSIGKQDIIQALRASDLDNRKLMTWNKEDIEKFALKLREISKPILIALNKIDNEIAWKNYDRIRERTKSVVPVSAESELALRKASKSGLIEYIPGEKTFKVKEQLNPAQQRALENIKRNVMDKFGNTGVQEAINRAVFELLNMIVVYPVEDEKKYSDRNGNVLPDALLVRRGSKAIEIAGNIHSDLAKGFLYALDAKRKTKIGSDYVVKDGDVIKIVSTMAK